MIRIPIRSDIYWYIENVELNGSVFRLEIAWNTRGQRWYLSILTSDGEMIVAGIPLVVDTPLINRFADRRLPYGLLMMVDTTGQGREPEQEDLGDRVRLIFGTVEEFAA